MVEDIPGKRGTIRPEFYKKYDLSPDSTPDKYANIFLPFSSNFVNGREMMSFTLLNKWTNTKASHSGAGAGGSWYNNFVNFTPRELR